MEKLSMLSYRYLGMYLNVAGVVPLGALHFLSLYVQQHREARDQCTPVPRSPSTLAPGNRWR